MRTISILSVLTGLCLIAMAASPAAGVDYNLLASDYIADVQAQADACSLDLQQAADDASLKIYDLLLAGKDSRALSIADRTFSTLDRKSGREIKSILRNGPSLVEDLRAAGQFSLADEVATAYSRAIMQIQMAAMDATQTVNNALYYGE